MAKLVAIHQPNFFPWLGYFDKLARSDAFLLMDNVQYPKTGGTWLNRVKLPLAGKAEWVTMPIRRDHHGVLLCREVRIDDRLPWRKKLEKTIQTIYGRAPYFDEVFPVLSALLAQPTDLLASFNVEAIRTIASRLGLDTSKLVLGSTLGCVGAASELIISMVKAVGGTAYLCGGGSGGYLDETAFPLSGIELVFQRFQHPTYTQPGESFIPGLSIIDALMNCGFAGTRSCLQSAP